MYQKATALALSSLTFLGIGLAVAQAATYSTRTNSYQCGIPAPTGHGAAYDAVLGGLLLFSGVDLAQSSKPANYRDADLFLVLLMAAVGVAVNPAVAFAVGLPLAYGIKRGWLRF